MLCNSNDDNYHCYESSSIMIDYNAWITIYDYSQINEHYNRIFTDNIINNKQYIISIQCPSNQCCQLIEGCNYTQLYSMKTRNNFYVHLIAM